MSPRPNRALLVEYGTKATHLALRAAALAPEQLRARRLRSQTAPPPVGGTKVLFVTPRDWAAHVQWESMIGQALRLRGADVRFLTCGGGLEICDRVNTWEGPPVPCGSCTRYVHGSIDAHGFPRTAIRDGWDGEDSDPGAWPELDELPLAELPRVEDGGLALGSIVDIPAKWFLLSSQLDDDPLAPITYRRFLRSARRIVQGVERALDEHQPEVVVLCNGLFLFEAIAWELCRRRGIDVVTYERGFIKETLLFRRNELACFGDVSDLWAHWSEVPLTDVERERLEKYLDDRRYGRRTIDRYWTNPQMVRPDHGGRPLVTLFTNLTWDSAVIGKEIGFSSIQDWLRTVIELFQQRPAVDLIIRIHPAEVKLAGKQTRESLASFVRDHFGTLPANVTMIDAEDDTSSYPLMEASTLGLVFASTTGLELALNGTPVVVAGSTHYRDKGFTIDVEGAAELEQAIDRVLVAPEANAPDVDRAQRYAYLFFFRAPVQSPGVEEHIPGLARITVDDLSGLAPGADESVDRICDTILDPLAR